jgi:hypothetical protein
MTSAPIIIFVISFFIDRNILNLDRFLGLVNNEGSNIDRPKITTEAVKLPKISDQGFSIV